MKIVIIFENIILFYRSHFELKSSIFNIAYFYTICLLKNIDVSCLRLIDMKKKYLSTITTSRKDNILWVDEGIEFRLGRVNFFYPIYIEKEARRIIAFQKLFMFFFLIRAKHKIINWRIN